MTSKFRLERENLLELYQIHSCAEIGEMFGVNAETVRKKLHEYQIPIGKVGGRRKFDPPKNVLTELYQTKSMLEIAEHFGVGETVVFRRLKEHGIELKDYKNHRLKPGRIFSDSHKANISLAQKKLGLTREKNPNWKGGLTEKNRVARTGWQAREWRNLALERAGFKCEKCSIDQGYECLCCGSKVSLHVHHIKSFSKHPELRYDPENSKVLCQKCHREEHKAMKSV